MNQSISTGHPHPRVLFIRADYSVQKSTPFTAESHALQIRWTLRLEQKAKTKAGKHKNEPMKPQHRPSSQTMTTKFHFENKQAPKKYIDLHQQ